MTLTRYLISRLVLYTGATAIILASISSLIELCEKMARAGQVGVIPVFKLIGLGLIPLIINTMPIASWIAAMFLIKELEQRDEWSTLAILSIGKAPIIRIFFCAGLLLCLFHGIVREMISIPMMTKAAAYKRQIFRKYDPQTLTNQWFMLDNNIICFSRVINTQTNEGNQLRMIWLSPTFIPLKILSAAVFHLVPRTSQLIITNGTLTDATTNSSAVTTASLHIPSFFAHLNATLQPPRLINLVSLLATHSAHLSSSIKHALLITIYKQLATSLLLIIYPLLTLSLFFLWIAIKRFRFVIIFMPYPIIFFLSALSEHNIFYEASPYTVLIPSFFVCLGLISYFLYCKHQEKRALA